MKVLPNFFSLSSIKSSHLQAFYQIDVGENYAEFTEEAIGRGGFFKKVFLKIEGTSTDILKNGVSKIVHAIKHANFQLYRVRPDGVIWKT